MNTVDFPKLDFSANNLKVGRSSHIIKFMKVCEY